MKKRGKPKCKGQNKRPHKVDQSSATKSAVLLRAKSTRNDRTAIAYTADDTRALALLLLPFLIISVFLGVNHSMKPVVGWKDVARSRPATTAPENLVTAMLARTPLSLPREAPDGLRRPASLSPTPIGRIELPPLQLPQAAPHIALAAPPVDLMREMAMSIPSPAFVLPASPPVIETSVAALAPAALAPLPAQAANNLPPTPFALPSTAPMSTAPGHASLTEVCRPQPKRAVAYAPASSADFGTKLAAAAQAQIDDFVVYSATYKRIAYPMGDIPSLYGSCSDVVIRAYRALGIDLQELVQRARVGSGDPSIDHRRTETLRVFFRRHGNALPVSTFAEDYKPGDIVTYYRPFSRVSRAHIAIVSSDLGPSGRPMIVHNRGWGPQLEDALFVDRITGHYRFSGAAQLAVSPSVTPRGGLPAVQRLSLSPLSSAKTRSTRIAARSE